MHTGSTSSAAQPLPAVSSPPCTINYHVERRNPQGRIFVPSTDLKLLVIARCICARSCGILCLASPFLSTASHFHQTQWMGDLGLSGFHQSGALMGSMRQNGPRAAEPPDLTSVSCAAGTLIAQSYARATWSHPRRSACNAQLERCHSAASLPTAVAPPVLLPRRNLAASPPAGVLQLVVQDLAPNVLHHAGHEVDVVDREQGGAQRLVGLEQVVQVGQGV